MRFSNQQAALEYLQCGWSVIPLRRRRKEPLIAWTEFQKRQPSEEEIKRWWKRWPHANVGIVTGSVSGIIALDVDQGADLSSRHVPITSTVQTGGGGRHYLFRHPGFPVPNAVRIKPGLDIRGDGGYIVAPPSVHPSGKHYMWLVSPEEEELADPPEWLLKVLRARSKGRWREGLRGVPEGARNETAASLAGKLLAQLPPEGWDVAWEALKA